MQRGIAETETASILIVDDQPTNQRLLSSILRAQGHRVRSVTSGILALEAVETDLPDVVLLDIIMPGMNGYEVCQRLKADPRACDVPVIFISALHEAFDKVRAFEVGGVDYITKPFQVKEVRARVHTHLALRRMHQRLQDQNERLQQEIADRERAEAALHEHQALFQSIIDHAPAVIFAKDLAGRHLLASKLIAERAAIPVGDMVGKTDSELVPHAVTPIWHKHDDEVIAAGRAQVFEEVFADTTETVTLLSTKFPLYDQQGAIYAVGGIGIDISERKRIEAALQRRDAILQAMGFAAEQFLQTANLTQHIAAVLEQLGTASGVSRVYVFANSLAEDGSRLMNQRYEWVAPGNAPQIDNPELQALSYQTNGFARWEELLSRGEAIYGQVASFPPSEQDILHAQDIRSIVVVPIFIDQYWWGFIGFDECQEMRAWAATEIDALRATGSIFGAAIKRMQIEEALREAHAQLEQRVQERTAELARSESRSRALLDALPDSMFLYRRGGLLLDYKLGDGLDLDLPAETIIGKRWCEMMPADFCARLQQHTLPLLETGERQVFEWAIDNHAYEIRLARCGEDQALAIVRNVTERRQAEAALIESEERYRTLVETAPNAVLLTDRDMHILFCNQQAVRLFGYQTVSEIVGRTGSDLLAAELADAPLVQMETIFKLGSIGTLEYALRRNDGSTFMAEINSAVVTDAASAPTGLIVVINDISERKRAEHELAATYQEVAHLNAVLMRSRNLLRAIFDNLDDGLLLLDGNGIVQEVNQPLARLLDSRPAALIGQPWAECYLATAPDFPGELLRDVLTSRRQKWQRRYLHPDKTAHILEFQSTVIYGAGQDVEQMLLRVADMTESIRLEKLVIENERFAASGRLAASVAHEINTPLQALQSYLHLIQVAPDADRATFLADATEELQRVGRIVRQFLDLYRPNMATPGPVDINVLVERILLLLGKRMRDQGVAAERALTAGLAPAWGRADELMQVLLNLMVNALDAMPDGGSLWVQTAPGGAPTDAAPTQNGHASGRNGASRVLTVAIGDSGCGMSPELQARIFEPFITTKEEGTGLGLAITAQIVEQHGGTISVVSQPGSGSTFTVALPVHQPVAEPVAEEEIAR